MAKIIVDVPDDVLDVLDEAAKAAGHDSVTAHLQNIIDARVLRAQVAKGLRMTPFEEAQDTKKQLDNLRRSLINQPQVVTSVADNAPNVKQ